MLEKPITYTDFDGNEVTEIFYFNLSKAEIAEMELSHDGGFSTHLQKIIKSEDGGQIIAAFKKIITDAVGRRSEDGRRFIKSPEITQEFLQTEAYSQLFMDLVTDGQAAADFVQAIVPSDMREAVLKNVTDVSLPEETDATPAYIRENRDPTKAELMEMSKEELVEAFRRKNVAEAFHPEK